MASMGDADLSEFKEFRSKIRKITSNVQNNLLAECAKGLTQKYLKSVTDLTPVKTGNLKGNWRNTKLAFSKGKSGVETNIYNETEYASYVEFGHRSKDHQSWIDGRYMMTKTNNIIEKGAPRYLDYKVKKFLEELDK